MALRLVLDRRLPPSIRLAVSPIAAALVGMRFVDGRGFDGCGGDAGPAHRSPRLHVTPYDQPRRPGVQRPIRPGRQGQATRAAHTRPDPVGRSRFVASQLDPRGFAHCTASSPRRSQGGDGASADDFATACARLRELLETDLRYRMRRLAEDGLRGLFVDLRVWVRFEEGVLNVDTRCDGDISLAAGRLTLMPTILRDRMVVLVSEPTQSVLLLYPVRAASGCGGGALPSMAELRMLAGGSRLSLLQDLHEPRSLEEVTHRHRMDAQSARKELAALTASGLLSSCPESAGQYVRTAFASALIAPWCGACS